MALTLHYDFDTDASLAASVDPVDGTIYGPTLDITRATDALTTDADGWLRTYQDNEARFQGAAFSNNLLVQSNDFDTTWINFNSSETGGKADLDGGTDAWELIEDTATSSHSISQSVTSSVKIGRTYVFSVYMKASTRDWCALYNNGDAKGKFFDLTNGVVGSNLGSAPLDSGIEDAGNGWYRCWIAYTQVNSAQDMRIYTATGDGGQSYTGDGTSGVFIYKAQLEDVSGAWDSYNSAPDSQGFTVGTWAKTNCAVTADSITDPDGGANGDLVTDSNPGGSGQMRVYDATTPSLEVNDYFVSVYAKQGTLSWINLNFSSIANTGNVYYDLGNGVKGTETDSAGLGILDSGIVDAGNGWYRCWVKVRIGGADVIGRFSIYGAEADLGLTITSLDGSNTFYLYGAQYELAKPAQTVPGTYVATSGATVQENYSPSTYIATTTVPVTSVSGANDGLLVEEARTNICLESEDITDATAWPSPLNASPSSNQTIAPDGSTAADKHIDDSGTGTGNVMVQQNVTVSTSTAYTYSVFLKADQLSWAALQVANFTTPANSLAYFDLTNGVEGTIDANFDNSGIEDYGNGWHRCWVSFTTDASDTTGTIRIYLADADTDIVVDRDGTSSIFVWGAQLEAGAFPTSYIPTTTGSSMTRNKEIISTTDFSWFSDTGHGTFYTEATRSYDPPGNSTIDQYIFQMGNGTTNNWCNYIDGADVFEARYLVPGAASQLADGYPEGTSVRSACSQDDSDLQAYYEGVAGSTAAADPQTDSNNMYIGAQLAASGTNHLNGVIAEIAYLDTVLSDADLSDLSDGTTTIVGDYYAVESNLQDRRRRIIQRRRANARLAKPRAEYWGERRIR